MKNFLLPTLLTVRITCLSFFKENYIERLALPLLGLVIFSCSQELNSNSSNSDFSSYYQNYSKDSIQQVDAQLPVLPDGDYTDKQEFAHHPQEPDLIQITD